MGRKVFYYWNFKRDETRLELKKKIENKIDSASATWILQSALDSMKE